MTKIKTIATALSVAVMFASTSFAGTTNDSIRNSVNEETVNPLSVQFLGEEGNFLIFQVTVKTESNKSITLSVEDFTEGELYAAPLNANKVSTFKIEKRDNQALDFKLQLGNKSYSESFTIMPNVVVTKL